MHGFLRGITAYRPSTPHSITVDAMMASITEGDRCDGKGNTSLQADLGTVIRSDITEPWSLNHALFNVVGTSCGRGRHIAAQGLRDLARRNRD